MASKNSSGESYGKGRTRSWTFLVYPDEKFCKDNCPNYDGSSGYGSAPYNWRSLLDNYHVPWAESPLHDRDINENGELKKPHWHVIIDFSSVKSEKQIEEIVSKLENIHDELATPEIQKLQSIKGMLRYFCHLDNPEKVQYDMADVVSHQGFDVLGYLLPSATERLNMLADMLDYIRENRIDNFADLVFYALDNKFDTWFYVLTTGNSIFFSQLFKSLRFEFKRNSENLLPEKK